MAFSGLAECHAQDVPTAQALRDIAAEEHVHDRLIQQLQSGLPEVVQDTPRIEAARRFHIGLVRGGPALHLSRIAALDSAVCLMFGRLLRHDGPIAGDPEVLSILRRIHREEARHVRVSCSLAQDHGPTVAMRDAAAAARGGLAATLRFAGDAFEALHVDPTALDRDLSRLPDGLLKI